MQFTQFQCRKAQIKSKQSWWQVAMIPCLWAFNHKSECQSKPKQTRPLCFSFNVPWLTCFSFNVPWLTCFSEQLLKNQSSKIDPIRYLFTILRPHGQVVDIQYGEIAWLPFPYPVTSHGVGGGGEGAGHRKGKAGFSGPNDDGSGGQIDNANR